MTKTIETIDCPDCTNAAHVTWPCPRCKGAGTIEHIKIVVHDRIDSKALIEGWIAQNNDD